MPRTPYFIIMPQLISVPGACSTNQTGLWAGTRLSASSGAAAPTSWQMLPHTQAAIRVVHADKWLALPGWLVWLSLLGLLMWTAAGLLLQRPQAALKHNYLLCQHLCLPQQADGP